jgi:hypothetical protein
VPESIDQSLDVSLVKLARSVKISRNVNIVCLPPNRNKLYTHATAVISGWGENLEETSKLKVSVLKVTTTEECSRTFNRKFDTKIREDYHICAAKALTNSTACAGDSGG